MKENYSNAYTRFCSRSNAGANSMTKFIPNFRTAKIVKLGNTARDWLTSHEKTNKIYFTIAD